MGSSYSTASLTTLSRFFLPYPMAVAEVVEGTTALLVAEEFIPVEFCYISIPLRRRGMKGIGQKLMVISEPSPAPCSRRGSRRGNIIRTLYAGALPTRHQRRKICRVGKKGKHLLRRVGKPLLGVESMPHCFTVQRKQALVTRLLLENQEMLPD